MQHVNILWIKPKIALVEAKGYDKKALEEANAKANNVWVMNNSVLKSTKGLKVFNFFEKKDVSEMTYKILSCNEYLIFTHI